MCDSADILESKIELAAQNCAGAIRAFCSVHPILEDYKSDNLPDLVTDLVHHTLQSGLMCLCRIWDKRQDVQSLHSIADLMNAEGVSRKFSTNLARRIELENLFNDSSHVAIQEFSHSAERSDDVHFSEFARIIEKEAQAIKSSHELGKIISYRSKYLAHTTTGTRLAKDKIITENDYKPVLDKTVAIVDKLLWLTKDQNGHLSSFFHLVTDCAREDWEMVSQSWKIKAA